MATASVSNIFSPSTLIESTEANQNFQDLVTFLNASVIHKDASVAFTGVPSGPSSDPVSGNQFTRKSYVDVPFAYNTINTSLANSSGESPVGTNWTSVFARGVTGTTSGFTIVTTRTYFVGVAVAWATSAAGTKRNFAIRRNGSKIDGQTAFAVATSASTGFGMGCSPGVRPIALTAGDTIDCSYNQDTGAGLVLSGALWILGIPGT